MNEKMESLIEKLQQERDELKLKMHLAKADARDEFEKLDSRWHSAKEKFAVASDEASELTEPVKGAARDLLEEIRLGYRRIRERL